MCPSTVCGCYISDRAHGSHHM